MRPVVLTKIYPCPPVSERDILRYAGCGTEEMEIVSLMRSALEEARDKLTYKVCYIELPVAVSGDGCDFELFRLKSSGLAKNLSGCESAILFGATVGHGIDRLISKYSRISPSRALMLQAIGAERVEALCDAFCADVSDGRRTKPRFSPGYGDLALEAQNEIFSLLDCPKRIGLSLSESMLMSPSKSVTAFMGICSDKKG